MTDDTKRAVEALKPLMRELKIEISADKYHLYLNDQAIGIDCNSTWATIMEAIGYVFQTQYVKDFRRLKEGTKKDLAVNIKRYWRKEDAK